MNAYEQDGYFLVRGLLSRAEVDALLDRISAHVAARRSRIKAAEATPALSAALVCLDLEIGLAPESMRETLASPGGARSWRRASGSSGRTS